MSQQDEHDWNGALYVSQDHLAARLAYLRRHDYDILPLDEACHRLYAGTLPPRSVALTFDDGAVDFALRAVPVLEAYQASATVYVTTWYTHHRLPVFDTALSYLLWRGRSSTADIGREIGHPSPLPFRAPDERATATGAIRAFAAARGMGGEEKDALLQRIASRVGVDYQAFRESGLLQLMPPEMIRDLPRGLVDVQLHTHRHRTPRDRGLFDREIRENVEVLRDILGPDHPLAHFCYPSGEYFGEFLDWLPAAGVRYATTCIPGLASPGNHPLLLPRVIDGTGTSWSVFAGWASGVADMLPARRQYRLDPTRLSPPQGVEVIP